MTVLTHEKRYAQIGASMQLGNEAYSVTKVERVWSPFGQAWRVEIKPANVETTMPETDR